MKRQFWTFRYALINILYFAGFCTIHAYAAVFLLDKGFTNTEVGIVLAVSNILSALLQPVCAGFIDRGKTTNRIVVLLCVLFLLLGCIVLLFSSSSFILVFAVFGLMYTVQFIYQPIIIAMSFEYRQVGCDINFGLARGLGSAGFAVTSLFLGSAIESFGTNVILYVTIVVMILSLIIAYFFKKPAQAEESPINEEVLSENKESDQIGQSRNFFIKYKKYTIFLVGVALMFFAHNAINDYMIQIIRNVGGNESQMGYATFLQAILELPVMAMIGFLAKKFKIKWLLVFSAVFFFIKSFLIMIATGMGGVYLSQACQLGAYALLIPAAAYYADMEMDSFDKVKGQAYINSAITIGGVFSSLICGRVLDRFGVKIMLTIGTVAALLGAITVFVAVVGKNRQNQ